LAVIVAIFVFTDVAVDRDNFSICILSLCSFILAAEGRASDMSADVAL